MSKAIEASIITIGDELLIGQVIDTNSAWMATQLNKIGLKVKRRVAVGDSWDEIWVALDQESEHAQIILITGGLGPTADDITKPLLCKYFDGKMVVDQGALNNVKNIFEVILKRPMIERNVKQAEVPDSCTVIPNMRGTAPGMLFEKDASIFISMPGVPHEMKGMMENSVIPLIKSRYNLPTIIHKTLVTAAVGESTLADLLVEFESELPDNFSLAYLPNFGMVRLRLSSTGFDSESLENESEGRFRKMLVLVNDYLVTDLDEPLQAVVGKLLLKNEATMATAESCTGGYIAHLITMIAGSSSFYRGSVVAYDYKLKEDLLFVKQETLLTQGAVSEATVLEMHHGLLQQTHADYGIAVSGIMGPGGGTAEKPVGTVWIAVGSKDEQLAMKITFRFDRQRNIELTAMHALNELRKFILGIRNSKQ